MVYCNIQNKHCCIFGTSKYLNIFRVILRMEIYITNALRKKKNKNPKTQNKTKHYYVDFF